MLRVLSETRQADTVWIALLAGAACWCVVYLLLPKPMWLYVVGHELTHAIWTWLFGGRVKALKANAKGGHVVVTKTNFLIVLGPYFFPFYAVLTVLSFIMLQLFFDARGYVAWFHLLLGAAYAFHVTLTLHTLNTHQSDISQTGYLFSGVVIWLGNVGVLLVGVPLLTGEGSIIRALSLCWIETGRVLHRISYGI